LQKGNRTKYIRIYYDFVRLDILTLMEYKFSFMLMIVLHIINIIIWIIFWNFIFLNIPLISGWSFNEMIILTGFSTSWLGIFGTFLVTFARLPDKIVNGLSLERYLCRPVNVVFGLLGEDVQIRNVFPQLTVGILTIIIGSQAINSYILPLNVLISFVTLLLGDIVISLIYGSLACLSFFVGKVDTTSFLHSFIKFTQFPLDTIAGNIKLILTFGIPSIFLSTYPTMILIGKLSAEYTLQILLILSILIVFWLFLFCTLWRIGLRRYQSGGG